MSNIRVKYIDHMGNDLSICNAARISMNDEADNYSMQDNIKLLHYLARGMSSKMYDTLVDDIMHMDGGSQIENAIRTYRGTSIHWTPFAHTCISIGVTAPIPIRTQCFKHKFGFVENEESRRYVTYMPELFEPDYIRAKATNIKQGSAGKHENNDRLHELYSAMVNEAVNNYEYLLEEGVCPEQARLVLPQGAMVNWVWTGSLFAFARFYRARTDSHAQAEIRELAEKVREIIEPLYPEAWKALTSY